MDDRSDETNKIRNQCNRESVALGQISRRIQKGWLRYFERVEEREEYYTEKNLRNLEITGKKEGERSKLRWNDTVKEDFREKSWKSQEGQGRSVSEIPIWNFM